MKEYVFSRHCRNCEKTSVCERSVSVGSVFYKAETLRLAAGEEISLSAELYKSSIIEIEEIHSRNDAVFAYSVFCKTENGEEEIYFRSYEPSADAPNGFFIRLPEMKENKKAELIFKCETGNVYFHKLYIHDYFELSEISANMLLGFFSPKIYWGDTDKSVAEVNRLLQPLRNNRFVKPAISFEIPYMNRSDREIIQSLEEQLEISYRTDAPLFVNLNSWWAGTPGGPDSKGGYFGDIEYQQVAFDPKTGRYDLTVPNMWSNTPWLTMNNPRLNKARRERLRHTVKLINKISAEKSAERTQPSVNVFLDNEPTYWAAFAYGGSPDAGGDFSPFLISDASSDGVPFEKGKALTNVQREWLLKNMNRYIDDLAFTCREESDKALKTSENGGGLSGDKIYTHVFPFTGYPYMDVKHPQWETHITPFAKLGIESSTTEEARIFDYISRLGGFGNINAERACIRNFDFTLQNYIYGADISMIFNYRSGDPQSVAEFTRNWDKLKIKERDYPVPIIDIDVFKDGMSNPAVVKSENAAVFGYRNRRVIRPVTEGTGRLLINAGKKSRYGNVLTVELWAFSHRDNGGISLSAGKTPECADIAVYAPQHPNEGSPMFIDMDLSGLTDTDTVWLSVEITDKTFDRDWSLINYIWHIRLMKRHKKISGHTNGFTFGATELRKLNMLSEQRADELLRSPKSSVLETAYAEKSRKAEGAAAAVIPEPENSASVKGRFNGISGNYIRIMNADPKSCNWQPYTEFKLSDICEFRLKKNSDECYKTITPNEIPYGCFAEVACTPEKTYRVDLTAFEIEGEITEVSVYALTEEPKNTEISVKKGNEIFRVSVGRECRLMYDGAPNVSISGCKYADPSLKAGRRVLIRYIPSEFPNVLPRAVYITDFKEKK